MSTRSIIGKEANNGQEAILLTFVFVLLFSCQCLVAVVVAASARRAPARRSRCPNEAGAMCPFGCATIASRKVSLFAD